MRQGQVFPKVGQLAQRLAQKGDKHERARRVLTQPARRYRREHHGLCAPCERASAHKHAFRRKHNEQKESAPCPIQV